MLSNVTMCCVLIVSILYVTVHKLMYIPLFSGKLSEDSVEDSAISGVAPRQFKSKLEEALTAKQESEAKVSTLENKLKQYEAEVNEYKSKVIWNMDISMYVFNNLI